jgi:hypothetical protein
VWLIESLLARGASLRDAAQQFGLDHSSIARHWKFHVGEQRRELLRQTVERAGEDDTPSLTYLTRMRDAAVRMLDAMEQARSRNLQGFASLLGRARELQLDIARLRGEDAAGAPGRVINGAVVPADAALEQRILEAVADDPEACARIARALRSGEAPALQAPASAEGGSGA